jgi:hypothetical protein
MLLTLNQPFWNSGRRRYNGEASKPRTGLTVNVSRRVKSGTLNVSRYHGRHRVHNIDFYTECDIVLTTYGTITADYRKKLSGLAQYRWFRIMLDEGMITACEFQVKQRNFAESQSCSTRHSIPKYNSMQSSHEIRGCELLVPNGHSYSEQN